MKKWLVGVVCAGLFTGAAMGQAILPTTYSGPWYGATLPTGWSQIGLGTDYAGNYDGVGGGAAKFDTTGDMLTINFSGPPGEVSYWIAPNSLSGAYVFKVEESVDGTMWSDVVSYNGSGIVGITAKTNVLLNASRYVRFNYVTKATGNVGVDGVLITAGASDFLVTFDKTDGFLVPEGSGASITATALNGTEPYGFVWSSTLGSSYYATNNNMFNISPVAPIGAYTTTVVATDGAAQSVTNAITFNVVPTYAITISAPINGTVATDPATQAIEGQTVTITATPDAGYRTASITVLDASLNPVALTGNTFTMPASAVTVTVLFEVYVAPDVLIDFEDYTGGYASNNYSTAGMTFGMTNVTAGNTTSDPKNGAISARFAHDRGGAGHPAVMMQSTAFAQPISKIGFLYADYGTDNTTTFKVQVSQDGSSWADVGEAAYDPNGATLMEGVIDAIPANMSYFQFLTLTGAGDRVNIDDIGVWFGAATFGVTFDKVSGFQVPAGSSDTITATAANGTEPYAYAWSSTLDIAYYSTNDNVFTIGATAPAGDYSATVVATDATAASVTNTISFSVMTPYAITITPPTNGMVTTTPAGTAIAGQTVTINATPNASYLVGTITVLDETMTPAPLTGNTFVMPASPVTVTVEFVYHEPSSLYISEVADPGDDATGGRFVELYNAGSVEIDLAAGTWYLARQINGGATWGNIALTGTVAAGSTYVVAGSTNFPTAYPLAPAPNQTSGTVDSNGDDGYFLFSGGDRTVGILEDAYGVVNEDGTGMAWEFTDARATRNSDIVQGNATWTAAEWTITAPANIVDMTPGVHPDGPVAFGVTFDKTDGFVVAEGASDTITATAANGTAPYTYAWSSTLDGAYYTALDNLFTILATAPAGSYSAEVVATDAALQSVTNTINFAVATTYGITITPPVNGAVTTTPATEAMAGATVTVNATPDSGYAVDTITVVGADLTPIVVSGSTFTMPDQAVTVTVTFAVYEPGVLIISQYYEGTANNKWIEIYNPGSSTVDLAAEGYRLGQFSNSNREIWKTDGVPNIVAVLTNTIAAGGTYLVAHGSATNPAYAVANQTVSWGFNGDDSVILYTGETYAFANVVDAFGLTNTTTAFGENKSFVRANTVTSGVNTDFNAADWVEFTLAEVDVAAELTNERLGYHSTGPAAPSVSIVGAVTGTVGAQMDFTITLLNGTASDWAIVLKDPTDTEIFGYTWDAGTGAFSFTPALAGSYYLSATALDAGALPIASNSVTPAVSSSANPPIAPITFVAGTGFTFEVPAGYTLGRVEGADAVVAGNEFTWTTLSSPADYTVSGTTVTILRAAAERRMVRIWLNP